MATRELQIDNGVFRVVQWTIAPDDEIPQHRHEFDYVVVPLVDATMHVLTLDGAEAAVELRAGQSYARASGAEHTMVNRGTTPIVFVEVERLHTGVASSS